jgi:hypothetical protein
METTYFTINPDIEIELLAKGRYEISICETYKNNNKIKGDSHQITYLFE